jgi:hypothetical protein
MSQFDLNSKGKQIIIIASITGLAVVENNGLIIDVFDGTFLR